MRVVITDGLLTLPFLHIALHDLEAHRLTEIHAHGYLLVTDLKLHRLARGESFLLPNSESDVLDFVHFPKFFLKINSRHITVHQRVGLLVQLYVPHLAVVALLELLLYNIALANTLQLSVIQFQVVVQLTMYLIRKQLQFSVLVVNELDFHGDGHRRVVAHGHVETHEGRELTAQDRVAQVLRHSHEILGIDADFGKFVEWYWFCFHS